MTKGRQPHDDLRDLLWSMEDGSVTIGGLARIDELVRSDEKLLHHYVEYMRLVSDLRFGLANDGVGNVMARLFDVVQSPEAVLRQPTFDHQQLSHLPIILDLSPAVGASRWSFQSPLVSGVFSYFVAALIMVCGLLAGWALKVSSHPEIVERSGQRTPAIVEVEQSPLVGRITSMVDCRWADPNRKVSDRDYVPLGQSYGLASGFMEITYDTGAKVILEGPAVYQVDSANGGFLSLGKLTALIGKKAEASGAKGERTANLTFSPAEKAPTTSLAPRPLAGKSEIRNPKSEISNPQSPIPNPLFSVRTPTVVVTDLGTEFGVEVDRSGVSRAHVFQGQIEMRPSEGEGRAFRPVLLRENESVVVESGRQPVVKVTRQAGQGGAAGFARQMPRWVRIDVSNTGGLKKDEAESDWELTAAISDPRLEPGKAFVIWMTPLPDRPADLPNDRARPQLQNPVIPGGAQTLHATFQFADVTAVVRGRCIAGGHVSAVRLNGRAVSVPEQGGTRSFDQLRSFTVREGFVAGTNVLEIDVFIGFARERAANRAVNPLVLRVQLEGPLIGGQRPAPNAQKRHDAPSTNSGKETNR